VPVSKENYLDVWVLLYNLHQEHNKTRWQFQLIEPHVLTEVAVPLLKDWNRGYTKKVVLHDINLSIRGLFDCLQSVAVSIPQNSKTPILCIECD
jgi:MarR-like DNA-binding transcriptional regulator SgrR of sgrS sRNA